MTTTLLTEDALIRAIAERDAWKAEAKRIDALLDAAIAERDRWIERNRVLDARLGHILSVARGDLFPPEIAEIRAIRGLDPL